MSWAAKAVVFAALTTGAVAVQVVRSRLAASDADPAAVVRLSDALAAIPRDFGGGHWVGEDRPIQQRLIEASGSDVYLSRLYRTRQGRQFHPYVGGSIANDESFHAPSFCLPAEGWEVKEEGLVPLTAYETGEGDRRMHRLRVQRGQEAMLVYFWFQAGPRLEADEFRVRLSRGWDVLRGAPLRPTVIVALYAPSALEDTTTETEALAFLRAAGPTLHRALSE
jgi:EpsI family protein